MKFGIIELSQPDKDVEEYPYRERLWYLLIDALLRDDRRVEALRACRALRQALATAGLSASDELTRWEEQICASGPELPHSDPGVLN